MADFFDKGGLGSSLLGAVPYVGSALSALFGDGGDSERERRKQQLLQQIQQYKTMALARGGQLKSEGLKDISGMTQGQIGKSQADIARRALASGRQGDAESMQLPATAQLAEGGNRNLANATLQYDTGLNDIANQYDQQALGAESDFASRPIQPSIADTLSQIGADYSKMNQNQQYLDALSSAYGGNQRGTNTGIGGMSGINQIPIGGYSNQFSMPTNLSSGNMSLPQVPQMQNNNYLYQPQDSTLSPYQHQIPNDWTSYVKSRNQFQGF